MANRTPPPTPHSHLPVSPPRHKPEKTTTGGMTRNPVVRPELTGGATGVPPVSLLKQGVGADATQFTPSPSLKPEAPAAGAGTQYSLNNPWGAPLHSGPPVAPGQPPNPPDPMSQMQGVPVPATPGVLRPATIKGRRPRSGDET